MFIKPPGRKPENQRYDDGATRLRIYISPIGIVFDKV